MAAVPYHSTLAGHSVSRNNRYASLWIWVFICPLAMDYKAVPDTTSHLAQILLAVPALCSGVILMLIAPRITHRSSLRAFVWLAIALAVPGSLVTQLIQDNPIGQYLRVLLPLLLFQIGFVAACRPWQEGRIEQFEKAIFWANVISLAFTFGYGLATGGPLEDVRYRIVSVTFLGLQGVLLHEFVIAKRFTTLTLVLFMSTIVIELLSVTRSLLVGTALLFALAVWMSAPSLRHLVRALLRAAAAVVVFGVVAFGAATLFPEVAGHWTQRLFFAEKATATGKDPTTITRLAEMKYQYDETMSSPVSTLVGLGYGHEYRYSPDYLPDLQGQISRQDFYAINEWSAGHNFWVYQFFAGGLLFGIALPVAILFAIYRCMITYRRWRMLMPHVPYLPVLGRTILLTAALPAASIGGNPLGPRFSGLVFGVSLGLMIAMHVQLRRLGAQMRLAPVRQHPDGRPTPENAAGEQDDTGAGGRREPSLPRTPRRTPALAHRRDDRIEPH